jgi:hypothetical protein
MTNSQYKSPAHKLINFFKDSRDKWKIKAIDAKKKIHSLTEMLRKVRIRRDELKAQVSTLQQQLKEPDKRLIDMEKRWQKIASSQKRPPIIIEQNSTQIQPEIVQTGSENTGYLDGEAKKVLVPANHHYNANTISMASELVITACLSFRAAGKCLSVIEKYQPIDTPSSDSIRQWVYRLGYYELMEIPKLIRTDWVFIADFTASIGMHRCFVVLGIPHKKLKQEKFCLTHQNVTLLGLELWEHSNGEKIAKCLENISQQVGVPEHIVIDGGSDIKTCAKLFCEQHPKTRQLYDISHKLARLLEKHLKDDEAWNFFLNSVSKAKAQSQQTPLAGLTPPALRTKARYMNLQTMTRWAVRILKYREKDNFEVLDLGFGLDEHSVKSIIDEVEIKLNQPNVNSDEIEINGLVERLQELVPENPFDTSALFHDKLVEILEPINTDGLEALVEEKADIGRAKFEEIFGWTSDQSSQINLYSTLLQMVEFVEKKLKTKGLNRRTVASCRKQIKRLGNCERSRAFGNDIMEFLEQQLTQVPKGKTYLASTDIIESVIGKFKFLNQRVASVFGINQSILLFGAITAKITPEKIKNAMEAVPWSKIKQWVKEKLPVSNFAKRCKALFDDVSPEQKPATSL